MSERFAVGDRVQVFNPTPKATGEVIEVVEGFEYGPRRVRVKWDDGETGWPRTDLLAAVSGEDTDA